MSDCISAWTRSSFCSDDTCVEVAIADGYVLVRDGKNIGLPPLQFSRMEWDDFCVGVTANEVAFD